jgi:hypothetical protein
MSKTREWTAAHDRLTAAARAIMEAERRQHEVKTARLREARLAKEAADLLAHAHASPGTSC